MDIDPNDPAVQDLIKSKAAEAVAAREAELLAKFATDTAGLEKSKNELLSEKKAEAEARQAYEAAAGNLKPEEIARLVEAAKKAEKDEHLKSGDIEGYTEKVQREAVERIRAEQEAVLATERSEKEAALARTATLEKQVHDLKISEAIRSEYIAAGGKDNPLAQQNAVDIASRYWSINAEGIEEARDPKSGELLKGKAGLLTKAEWVNDYLKPQAGDYLFEKPAGSGATGGTSSPANKKASEMSAAEIGAFIKENGDEAFLALPS